MTVSVGSRKLAKVFAKPETIDKRFGTDLGKQLRKRLDDLVAAETLDDIRYAPGRLDELTGDRRGQFALRLSANVRMIIEPADDAACNKNDDVINLRLVTAVRIVEIVDYH
jgi:proteic killer suppression protein